MKGCVYVLYVLYVCSSMHAWIKGQLKACFVYNTHLHKKKTVYCAAMMQYRDIWSQNGILFERHQHGEETIRTHDDCESLAFEKVQDCLCLNPRTCTICFV